MPSLGGLVALVLVAPSAAAASRGPSWSQLGYDSGRTGWNPTETTLDASNVDELEVAWVRDSVYRGTPVISKGLGYVEGQIFDPASGSDAGALADGPVDTESAAVVRGRVVSTSWDETLSAKDAQTGEMLWAKPFGAQGSSPTVSGGRVFVRSENAVRAVRPTTGAPLWKARLRGQAVSDVSVDGDRALVLVRNGYGPTKLLALDASSGEAIWTRKVAYSSSAHDEAVVADNGIVLASVNYRLSALDANDGSTLWTSDVGCCRHAPALAGDTIFTTTSGASSDKLHAVDAGSGEVLWSTDLQGVSDGVSVANGVVYVASNGLEAFEAATGDQLLDLDVGVPWSVPVVVGGTVYLAIENGPGTPPDTGEGLYAFRLP